MRQNILKRHSANLNYVFGKKLLANDNSTEILAGDRVYIALSSGRKCYGQVECRILRGAVNKPDNYIINTGVEKRICKLHQLTKIEG